MRAFFLATLLPVIAFAKCPAGFGCCLGEGNCITSSSCCPQSSSCCATGFGTFTCCNLGFDNSPQKCLPATGGMSGRSCQAVDVNDEGDDGICLYGGQPIRDQDGATMSCGNAYPTVPCYESTSLWASYCDYSNFPTWNGALGFCCTQSGPDNSPVTCAKQDNCGDCTRQGCAWDGTTCASECLADAACFTEEDQCTTTPVATIPGTCFNRCGDLGAVRLGIAPQIFFNQPQVGYAGQIIQGNQNVGQLLALSQLAQLAQLGQLGQLGLGYPFQVPNIAVSPSIYCSCDNLCQHIGDCCYDIEQVCRITQVDPNGVPLN